jgi:outer membrane lipoprotein carrier protein
MRSIIAALLVVFGTVMVPSAAADPVQGAKELTNAQLVEQVKATYAEAQSLRADFVQVVTTAGFGVGEKQRGRLVLKRPKKMRWEFKAPHPRSFVTDGETMWIWSPQENGGKGQVIVYKNMATAGGMTDLLTDLSKLDEYFAVERVTGDPHSKRLHVLSATPKDDGGTVKNLKIWLTKRHLHLERVVLTDKLGNVTDLNFSQVKINPANVKNTEFSFTAPKGAEVIESAGM